MRSPTTFYLQNRILGSPLEVLFTLLIFILSKSLNATPFQLMVIACSKPITALFSYYISSLLHSKPRYVRSYLIANMLIGVTPCFFYPFIDNVWFYIASYALFMVIKRAEEPARIELLMGNPKLSTISQTVSKGTSTTYFMSMFLPPLLSFWLDDGLWKALFVIFGLLQLVNVATVFFLTVKMDTPESIQEDQALSIIHQNVFTKLIDPLKRGVQLLHETPSFAHYLFLYFLGGAGIVLMQPTLPLYFKDQLDLSYQQLTLAFSFCKGVSFLITSPIWANFLSRISLYWINALMNLLTCLFIVGVLGASHRIEWLYAGYLCYGAMQGGSELSWNMSGPIFSKNNKSAAYSSMNLLLVGIRGCICPFLGYLIFTYAGGAIPVFMVTMTLCVAGIAYGLWLDVKYSHRNSFVLEAK